MGLAYAGPLFSTRILTAFFFIYKTIFMTTMNSITQCDSKSNLSLHKLVDDVINVSSPVPAHTKSPVVNNVPANLYLNTNKDIVASVIDGLLNAVIMNATDGEIYVSAKELFGNTVKVFVKDNNCYNTYAVACGLLKVVPLAEKIGGYLNIINQRQKITTIEFSFPLATEEKNQFEADD